MKRNTGGKAYYMISAVAQKYNIHPQTLRLYEREGLLKPSRTEGNTRLYSEEDLEQLETILSLTRDLGVNLAGVEIILNMRRKIERDAGRGQRVHGVREARARRAASATGSSGSVDRARQIVADRSRARRARRRTIDGRTLEPTSTAADRTSLTHSIAIAAARIVRYTARRICMPCPLCDDTGWKPVEANGVRRVVRCDCWRDERRPTRLLADASIPPRYQHCTLDNFITYQREAARTRVRAGAARSPTQFPAVAEGAVPRRAARRRQDALAVAVLKQVIQTTGARGLFYDTRDLLRVIRSTYDPLDPDRPSWTSCGR